MHCLSSGRKSTRHLGSHPPSFRSTASAAWTAPEAAQASHEERAPYAAGNPCFALNTPVSRRRGSTIVPHGGRGVLRVMTHGGGARSALFSTVPDGGCVPTAVDIGGRPE